MTKAKGRPKRGRLVSMVIKPPPEVLYVPPPPDECEEYPERIVLLDGHVLAVRRLFYRDLIVDFAVNQSMRVDREWVKIGRIDCFHSEVHRHQFTAAGGNERTVLEVIPARGGEELVDRWCDRATKIMHNEWQGNVRRWHGDDQ